MSGSPNTPPPPLKTRIVNRVLRELKLLEKRENARFMSGGEYRQLVANLKVDRVLTSAPLIYRDVVVSGNHRVQAAIEAEIETADCIEIVEELTPERLRALQLSHNAIAGKDDPGTLAELYKNMPLVWKQYSGLTDAVLAATKDLNLGALALGAPNYQQLVILFLPEVREKFDIALKAIDATLKKGVGVLAGRLVDFDAFFASVVQVKKVRGIHNSAIALLVMAEITKRVLDDEEAKKDADGGGPPAAGGASHVHA